MSDIRIGLSPLTGTIYAGRLNKAGTMWNGKKYDVTDECVMAVVDYIKKHDVIYERDGVRFRIKEVLDE